MAIPISSSELLTIDGSRNNFPNRKVPIAKGMVLRSGASELTFPSLLCPALRFTNDPAESPNMQPRPSTHPIAKAVERSPPR